jgi:hypothetical protein
MDALQQPLLVPAEGARIGIQSHGNSGAFLPFQVTMVTKKYVTCISPLNPGMRVGFRIGEGSWTWKPWTECPPLTMRCKTCKGNGWVRDPHDKAEVATLTCGMCLGGGEVERDDPFTPTH